MHLLPRSDKILRHMSYTRREVTLLITNSSVNPQRRCRTDMFVLIFQMAVTRRNPRREQLEEHL
jgi:hypothetical protein